MITTTSPTTPPTVVHDSTSCSCFMCRWAELRVEARQRLQDQQAREVVEQSAATIRTRRAALLERADAGSPTEGAIALAQAHLEVTDWFQILSNNATQDATVLELAGRVEAVIGEYIDRR